MSSSTSESTACPLHDPHRKGEYSVYHVGCDQCRSAAETRIRLKKFEQIEKDFKRDCPTSYFGVLRATAAAVFKMFRAVGSLPKEVKK